MVKLVGAHLSINRGIEKIEKGMRMIGARCCGIFLKNQKRYASTPLKEAAIRAFKEKVSNPELIVPHGSYLINLGNPEKIEQNYECLIDDLKRCNILGIPQYNLHPGSDVKNLGKKCLDQIVEYLNMAVKEVPHVRILLENMAGQGKMVCSKFEDFRYIIERIDNKERIGVCLDTCHLFSAGYDIRTGEKFELIMKDFDDIVGLKYLKAMHLNDSKTELGSRRDRHESIGKGKVGLDAFRFIMNSKYFDDIPMILETPNIDLYKEEIELLYSLVEE